MYVVQYKKDSVAGFELLRLLVGAHHPLVLLKSQLNFQTGKLNFDEMLYMEPFPALHAYADSALYIIFQSLLKMLKFCKQCTCMLCNTKKILQQVSGFLHTKKLNIVMIVIF